MADNSTDAEPTDLEKKIIRQIEYYFGNSNLRRDRFLQLQIREDDGWIPMETMLKFNRLSQLSKDADVIVNSLKKSKSGLMEVSEDKQKIRRSPDNPLPEENASNMLELKARTVYCKGFPLDATIDKIQTFFDQYGDTEAIFMRRDKERNFKGSVFATYKTKADAQKFMAVESMKYEDKEMVCYFKSDYYKMKSEERKTQKEQSKKDKKEKKQQIEDEAVEANTEYQEFERGLVMYFTGACDQTSREDLKEVLGDYGVISWIEFNKGETEGSIRFESGTNVKEIIEKVLGDHNDKLEIRGSALTMRVLEGEEEDQHWKQVFENRTRGRMKKQQGRRKKKDRRPNKFTKYEGQRKKFKDSDDEGDAGGGGDGKTEEEKPKAEGKRPLADTEAGEERSAKQIKAE